MTERQMYRRLIAIGMMCSFMGGMVFGVLLR